MSSLACKSVFYRSEHNAKGDPTESWNAKMKYSIPTERTEIDDANRVICLVIMFTTRVVVNELSKMADVVFSADDSKKLVTICAKYLSAPESSYWLLSEKDTVNRL